MLILGGKRMVARILATSLILFFLLSSVVSLSMGFEVKLPDIIEQSSNRGNILYVGGSGPDNYTTIQVAIDDANDGDTVYVFDDSSPYYENVIINKSINLIGEDRNITVIDGKGNGDVVYVSADFVTIRGFTIQNSGSYWNNYLDIYDAGLELKSNYNIICDNIIANNNFFGVILDNSSYNVYISDNIITNNYATGIILANSSNNNRIFSNSITNNDFGCRIVLSSNNNNLFKNNIKDNLVDGVVLVESSKNGVYKNIISNNGFCGLKLEFYNYNTTISYNIISNNGKCGLDIEYNNCNNTASENIILNNGEEGIDLHHLCNNNLILQNTIKNNKIGIDIFNSNNNYIYRNNFINNEDIVNDRERNIWDDGKYGNYWSDYKQRYPDAKRIWLRGIWDTAYDIPGGDNKDMYPLIMQWPYTHSSTLLKIRVSSSPLIMSILERFPILHRLFISL
jgi:parallel beta-helix repeat protein